MAADDRQLLSEGLPAPPPQALASAPAAPRLSQALCIGYGIGDIPPAILGSSFGFLILHFLTDSLGLAAATAGMMIAASKIYDAVADPLMGVISDRFQSRLGRRRPFLLLGAVMSGLAIVALFAGPEIHSPWLLHGYVAGVLLLYSTAYTVWQVPYMTIAVELSDDYAERSRVMAYMLYGGMLGSILLAVCGPWLLALWGGGRVAYARAGWVLAAVCTVSGLICFIVVARAHLHERLVGPRAGRARWHDLLSNRPLVQLISIKVVTFVGLALSSSVLPYFVLNVMHESNAWTGNFIILSSIASALSIHLWLLLHRRWPKHRLAMVAYGLQGLTAASWMFWQAGEGHAGVVLRILISGASTSGTVLLLRSMCADTIEVDYLRTGLRREGAITGLLTLVEKGASALGLAGVGLVLGAAGYVASSGAAPAPQPSAALSAVTWLFAMAPALAGAFAVAVLSRYELDAPTLERLRLASAVADACSSTITVQNENAGGSR